MKEIPFKNRELPLLDELDHNLWGASFKLMKLMPARYMLEQAFKSGKLREGDKVIETSSGTFALALSMICNQMDLDLTIISDTAIDSKLKMRLEELGTELIIIDDPDAAKKGGIQHLRLKKLLELREKDNYFWPRQYDNLDNRTAYFAYAKFLVEQLGKIDYLVGPVGSGGSMVGTTEYLKKVFPNLKSVGVDTPNSVLFGQSDGIRKMRGLGNSLHPRNLDTSVFDIVTWIPANLGFEYARRLFREQSLFRGPTSGSAYLMGKYLHEKYPDKKIVCNFPDEGYRYLDTVYNPDWIEEQGLIVDASFEPEIKTVTDPTQNVGEWTVIDWKKWKN